MLVRIVGFLSIASLLTLTSSCLSSNMKNTWSKHDDALINWVRSGDRVSLERFAAPLASNAALEKRLINEPFAKLTEAEGKFLLAKVGDKSVIPFKPISNGIWIVVKGVHFLERDPKYLAHLLEDKTLSIDGISLGGGKAVYHHLVLVYVEQDFTRVVEYVLALRS